MNTSSSSPADRQQHHQQQQQQLQQPPTPSSSDRKGAKSGESSSSATTSYGSDKQKEPCLDVTSHRFLPDDDLRIAVMLRKMVGNQETAAGCINTGITTHDFPTVFSSDVTGIPLQEAPGSAELYNMNDDARFVVIVDFATVERPETAVYHTVTRRESITFILVSRPETALGKKRWEVPTLTDCQDYINDTLSRLYNDDMLEAKAYLRSGKWGAVQTIVLNSTDMEVLNGFRRQITLWPYRGRSYDTFPRDVVIAKPDISILLQSSMKTFQSEIIPKVLFKRNADIIAGALRVQSTRFHTAEETSHKGESKEYWRTIELKGDEQLMRCLRTIPENRPFLLGYDAVQIRGGLRPQ